MRWWLQNTAQLLFAFAWSAWWISAAAVVTVLTFNRSNGLIMARHLWAPALIKFAGARFKCEPVPAGIDWSQPYIFVMNHQSMIDIPCAFAAIPSNIRFVVKEELKLVPFIGWFVWLTGMVFVDRRKRSKAVLSLEKAGERIRSGATIIAYPEGTRSSDGKILPFKKGPFVLALTAGVPIIPVGIEGTWKVSPKEALWRLRPADVRMKIGQPIITKGRSPTERDQLLHEVRAAVIALNVELGGQGGVDSDIAAVGVEGV